MRVPRSLTSRLVLTTVALVALASVLVAVATTLAMRDHLTDELDAELRETLDRATGDSPVDRGPLPEGDHGPGDPDGPGGADPGDVRGQRVGTLTVTWGDCGPSTIITAESPGVATVERVPGSVVEDLGDRAGDEAPGTVDVGEFGSYRVLSGDGEAGCRTLVGLPTEDVDDAVASLVRWELALGAIAVVLAGIGGSLLVRRQLQPLHEVASTAHAVAQRPLDSGEIGAIERVPDNLTDPDTEVGQVGQALNTLLAHVEASLDVRHRSEQQVRQFVADASHELRTPLTTIVGYTELARRREDPEATATALVKVEEEAARMTALVEDLLLLARLDSGRPLAQEPVDLTRLLLEAVADARVLAPDHHWHLELPEDAVPVEVTGDADRLRQVATNLLTNARKYTPAGTTVTVALLPDGFEVSDDGPGFPADLVPVAFERFSRGDASRHREGGVGLGLALVQAIVAAHGGTVSLASEPARTAIRVTSLAAAGPRAADP
ncbi:ATP-binding protein [Nocardioides sp. HM23]|uniref:sensor histidine kinase n=1 Tax=Nocardioides bizhenqiangii TaxID=3095076 RepID=UPI002ACB0305|nr:ATP-binding protein [Nocardioides sp. HM23]MDZ5621969.1 ATP-binding protein [Nocardioides sp. HM23]